MRKNVRAPVDPKSRVNSWACKRRWLTIVPGPGKARTARPTGLGKALAARHISHMSNVRDSGRKEAPKGAPDEGPKRAPEQREIGGPRGPEPTRYGDWEQNGRCTDF